MYSYYVESQSPMLRLRSYESKGYKTLKEAYTSGYRELKRYGQSPVTLIFFKNGNMWSPTRNMRYDPGWKCIVLSIYGKNVCDYKVTSDGKLKLIMKYR